MHTRAHAEWIDDPKTQAPKPLRAMRVTVVTDTQQRYEYDGMFRSTFDAYENALDRFAHLARIDVQPLPTLGASDV